MTKVLSCWKSELSAELKDIRVLLWRAMTRTCSKRCFFLVVLALCLTMTIIYGHYHNLSDGSHSQDREREVDSSWSEDYDDGDLWRVATEKPEEMIEGPCSLRKATRKDPLIQQRFNFSVPVLQWGGSFSEAAWQRLRRHAPPYGWEGLPLRVVRSTLALLNSLPSSRLFERTSPDQCVRCAVVGNGGILRGSKQGQAIDGHDFVFRVNGAVTEGFEEDVGEKTSFYGFTTNTMKHSLKMYRRDGFTKVPQNPGIRYIFIPSSIRDYVMMTAAILGLTVTDGEDLGDQPSRYFGYKPPEHFKMLHPDFITYVTQRFLQSPLLTYAKTRHLYMPSTGALMLMAALHTCDQVSAYGFITKNYADFSDHYYDAVMKPLRFYANHDMQMESLVWEVLDSRDVIQLYKRTVRG